MNKLLISLTLIPSLASAISAEERIHDLAECSALSMTISIMSNPPRSEHALIYASQLGLASYTLANKIDYDRNIVKAIYDNQMVYYDKISSEADMYKAINSNTTRCALPTGVKL